MSIPHLKKENEYILLDALGFYENYRKHIHYPLSEDFHFIIQEVKEKRAHLWCIKYKDSFISEINLKEKMNEERNKIEEKIWFKGKIIPDLKKLCSEYGLKKTGSKNELLRRLGDHKRSQLNYNINEPNNSPEPDVVPTLVNLAIGATAQHIYRLSVFSSRLRFHGFDKTGFSLSFLPLELQNLLLKYLLEHDLLTGRVALILSDSDTIFTDKLKLPYYVPSESLTFPRIHPNTRIFIVQKMRHIDYKNALPCKTIEEAILQSKNGDIILVGPGRYRESLKIKNHLEIIGIEEKHDTILEVDINISCSHVRLNNLSIIHHFEKGSQVYHNEKHFFNEVKVKDTNEDGLINISKYSYIEVEGCVFKGVALNFLKGSSGLVKNSSFSNTEGSSITVKFNADQIIIEDCIFFENNLKKKNTAAILISLVTKEDSFYKMSVPLIVDSKLLLNNNTFYNNNERDIGIMTDIERNPFALQNFDEMKGRIILKENSFSNNTISEQILHFVRDLFPWEWAQWIPEHEENLIQLSQEIPKFCYLHNELYSPWVEGKTSNFFKCPLLCIWGVPKERVKIEECCWKGDEQFRCTRCGNSCITKIYIFF